MLRSSPVGVSAQDSIGHLNAHAALPTHRALGRLLGHRAVGRPIHVEVVREDELRARLGRCVEDGFRHGRKQLGPLPVVGLCAVVDDGRVLTGLAVRLGAADVRRCLLDTRRQVARAAPRHSSHPQSPGRELADDRGASGTRCP